MICPMVEQAHFGTTRYTMLSLGVIQVPGKFANAMLLYAKLRPPDVIKAKKPCHFNVSLR